MSEVEEVNVGIVGGGLAGLNLALWLQECNRTYVVWERGVVFHQWKHARWDGFMMNTPIAFSRLHGQDDGLAPGTMKRPIAEDIERWEAHIRSRNINVKEQTEVKSVTREPDGWFRVATVDHAGAAREYRCRNVVACNGNYQVTRTPSFAAQLPVHIRQINVCDFRNSSQFLPGNVLIVGAGQTGCQIADLLSSETEATGRRVFLATSMVAGSLRSYKDEDIFFWFDRIGFSTMTKEALESLPPPLKMAMRYGRVPITGAVKPISPFSLHRQGVVLLGGVERVKDGDVVTLTPTRKRNMMVALEGYHGFANGTLGPWLKAQGQELGEYEEPEWKPVPELLESDGPEELSLTANNITNVLFATGWQSDFSWVKVPGVVEAFDPISKTPNTLESPAVPGFFFSGFHWLQTIMSANVVGFEHDHKLLLTKLLPA